MAHLATFIAIINSLFSIFTTTELSSLNVNIENWVITKSEISSNITWLNIVCVGDSNTAWTTWFTASKRYCDLIGVNHPELSVYNAWFTTLTATDLITRNVTEVYPHKVEWKRNIATLLIGTNDYWFSHTIPQTWSDIKIVIANLKAQWFEVLVMTYPPRIWDTTRNIFLRNINSIILTNQVNLDYKAIDTYYDFIDQYNQDNTKVWMLQSDLLHFTELWHYTVYSDIVTSLWITPIAMNWNPIIIPTWTWFATISQTDKDPSITVVWNTISTTSSSWKSVRATIGKSSGKWYWEVQNNTTNNKYWMRGIGKATAPLNTHIWTDINGYSWYNDWTSVLKFNNWSSAPYGNLSNNGDIIGFALDMDSGTLTAYKNGVSQGVMYSGLSGILYPMFSLSTTSPTMTVNFGTTPFAYPVSWFNPLTN